jgi:hypothetical protein
MSEFNQVQEFLAKSMESDSARRNVAKNRIFISYRRSDSDHAADRIYERLVEQFGIETVFYDVSSISAGEDFEASISLTLASCSVAVVVIGDYWLNAMHEGGPRAGCRRLIDTDDQVRIEIETALTFGIQLIPVLVGRNSRMPQKHELPDTIAKLAIRNATVVPAGPDFHRRLDCLLVEIEKHMNVKTTLSDWFRNALGISGHRSQRSEV